MRRLVASRTCACVDRRGRALHAESIRDGLRLEAIAADITGDTALELLGTNAYDIAVLDRGAAGPSGEEIAGHFTNTVRITVSALRKCLGEPGIIATVADGGARRRHRAELVGASR